MKFIRGITRFLGILVAAWLLLTGVVAAAKDAQTQSNKPESAELKVFKKAIRAQYDIITKAYDDNDWKTIVYKFYAEDAVIVWDRHFFSGPG